MNEEQNGNDLIADDQQDIIKMYRDATLPLDFALKVHLNDTYVRYTNKVGVMQFRTYPINVSEIVRDLSD